MKKVIKNILDFILDHLSIIVIVIILGLLITTRIINDGYYNFNNNIYYKHNNHYYLYENNDWTHIDDKNFKIDLSYKVSYEYTRVTNKFNGLKHLIDYVSVEIN